MTDKVERTPEEERAYLRVLIERINALYGEIEDCLTPHVLKVPVNTRDGGTQYDDGQWYTILDAFWKCEKSPVGVCVYHKIFDRAHDNCVFCHEPYERK